MRGKIGMGDLWRDAVIVACARLDAWDETKAAAARAALAGSACLFDLAALAMEEFDVSQAVARLQAATRAGTGP